MFKIRDRVRINPDRMTPLSMSLLGKHRRIATVIGVPDNVGKAKPPKKQKVFVQYDDGTTGWILTYYFKKIDNVS
jgi:hypothetical protein